ncbi:T9SS type A sorting domain-containing protein [Flavobacterium sp. W22_SRS_FP1]|uniref:Ig-like domain-containing protein n=1 Tax=Flavobacterium sp. W22_SRS_FP1 TaxID=3240276 RepID=UPI003F8DEF4B
MEESTITKLLEVLAHNIRWCLFSKKTVSKLNLLKFEVRTILPFIFMAIMTVGYTVDAQNIQGIAPVETPKLGFGVDGNAWAHEPISNIYLNVGDWFDYLYNTDASHLENHGLFTTDGNLLYKPLTQPGPPAPAVIQPVPVTYFLKDPYTSDPTIFTKSNKINDNPKTYTWGSGSSPNKNEIQNAAAHFSYGDSTIRSGDGTGPYGSPDDLWCLFAADRQVINGSSYIDFEFLQAPLKLTGDVQYGSVDPLTNIRPIIGGSGGFSSGFTPGELDATGGRTPGDILVTIEFTQGGGEANVVIRSWSEITPGAGMYQYVIVSNSADGILGNIFCTNNDVQTNVPFDVYGSGSSGIYEPNQWAEGAVNITQVFKYYQKPCFVLSTLFIRTRSSGSSDQSELKDFPGAPIQLNLNFIPDAPATTSATVCGPSGVVNLSASGCPGGTLKWYTTETGDVKVNEGLTYSPTISLTTSYWVSCTNAKGCEGPRAEVTGTLNTITPGSISGDQTLCSPFDPSAFTSTTLGSGGGVITYQWESSTTSAVAGFSNIGGATSAAYDAPAVAVTTWFRRTAISTLNTVPCSDYSNVLVVTPNAVAPGAIAGNQTLCTPADPAAFTSTTAGSGDGVITYQWQISTTSCDTGFSNIGDATSATYDAPTVTGATYFRRVVTSTLNGVPCTANSNCLTITPEEIHPGEIAGSQTLCAPFDPVAFTSVIPGSNNGVITYQWQSSTTSAVAGFSNIVGATSATYDSPAVAVTTWFRRTATSTLNTVPCSDYSNVLVVTPNAIVPGTISGDQTLCSPFNPSAFTSTTLGSGGGVITYQWQSSTTSAVAGFSNIGGATSATYDAPAVAVTTWFRRTAISTLNTVPCSDYSNVLVVTPNAVAPGAIAGNQTLCTPADPAAFTSTTAGSGDGVITYQWQISTTSCDTGFSNIGDATSATYDAPTVTGATYFRRVVTSTLNGVPCTANSNCLTITPEEIHPGEIAGSQTLCAPFDPVAFTSVIPGSNNGVITYQWQSSTTSAVAGFSNIGGATSATYDSPAVAVTTWFRRTATSTLNTVPCSDYSNVLVITPNNVSSGSITGDQKVCIGDDPAAFISTTAGTGSGAITYQWQSNTTGCGSAFTDIVGATSATYDPGVASVTTYYLRVTKSTVNDVICSANSNCLTVTAEICSKAICTYTQGYYGNLGGKSCAPYLGGNFGPYTTLELIERALSSYNGGLMTIGSLGNTVVINNTSADRMAIINVLPGGGSSYVLSNENSISSLPYLSKNGRINNTLLAQTITLGLNIGINASLSDFVLQSGILVTADPEGGCGSETAKTRICNYTDGILTSVTNDYHYYSIDASVINAIDGDKTVQGLFKLANKALGGGDTNGVSLSNIASVVDKINNAFDGCKIFMGYDVARCLTDEPGSTSVSTTSKTVDIELAGFTASPVPFKDQLTVKYDFDYQSDVKIEVFNSQGNRVLSKADTNSYLGKEVRLNLDVNRGQEQVYVIKLTTNQGSSTRKIMSSR